jgi:hypothetical protein
MTPTYITFEQGKLLKDKGFIQTTIMGWTTKWYDNNGNLRGHGYHGKSNIPAPQQWEVVEWLWEKHKIHVGVELYFNMDGRNFSAFGQSDSFKHPFNGHKTRQEAYSAAFDYILKELI